MHMGTHGKWWLSLLLVAGCGAAPEANDAVAAQLVPAPDDNGNPSGTSSGGSVVPLCRHVTVSGNLYYNDQRLYGRYGAHQTPSGKSGTQYKVNDKQAGGSHATNYLSLNDAQVELYEVDVQTGKSIYCSNQSYIATVNADDKGHFSWTGDICDQCTYDDGINETSGSKKGVSLAAKVLLRYCPDGTKRCFSVKKPAAHSSSIPFDEHDVGASTYAVWHGSASALAPKAIFSDGNVVLNDLHYELAGDASDDYSQAAMVFESLSDATRRLHGDLGIPSRSSTFGEVKAIYPMNWPNHGAGHSHERLGDDYADTLCVSAPGTESGSSATSTTWETRGTPFHEYGHIINYRAWGGYGKYVDYGYSGCILSADSDGDGSNDCNNESDNEEFASAAWKEHWANFMRRVALNEVRPNQETLDYLGCAFYASGDPDNNTSFDDDDSAAASVCTAPTPCEHGDRSPLAVERTLCDLFDNHIDGGTTSTKTFAGWDLLGDKTMGGIIDDLEAVWDNGDDWRRDAYINASDGNGEDVKSGFGICEFAAQRIRRVPTDQAAIESLLAYNGIDCNF